MQFDPLQDIMHNIATGGYRPTARVKADKQSIIDRTVERAKAAGLEVNGEMGAIMVAVFSDLDNVYITGGAGTGKTTFIKQILIPELEYRGLNYHITASTGIAGTHIDGKTIHSFLGIGLGPEWPPGVPVLNMEADDIYAIYEATYERWQNNPRIPAAIRDGLTRKIVTTEVILLEEVSMIAGWGLLGYVDFFLKRLRNDQRPFGGVQMVFVGDMGQLPPVERYAAARPDWAFMCEAWTQAKVRPMKFTKIHRQKQGWFTQFLDQTRDGRPVSPFHMQQLKNCLIADASPHTHPNFTFLCSTNKEADNDNRRALALYPGPTVELKAVFDVREDQLKGRETIEEVRKRLIESRATLKEVLHLRVGLPVLLTVNNAAEGYVNGTKGFVHKFVTDSKCPEHVTAIEVRVPSKNWTQRQREAMSPSELEAIEIDEDVVFQITRRYWSRSSSEPADEILAEDPAEFAKAVKEGRVPTPRHRYPVVGQFPIIPATAITTHKSQGMSLDDVVVRVDRAFAPGQVYVGLSRLRSPEGLVLTSLDLPIFADPTAAAFNQTVRAESVDMGISAHEA